MSDFSFMSDISSQSIAGVRGVSRVASIIATVSRRNRAEARCGAP
jgi:hypothetical protein